ncbi:helix-turn-helix domain-containing protein [Paenibacillus daejeonensis]|uniref:helix-turn-helix domain-containing protein n=1 Tax=Paenibacillus daejeonensis TaxID=135193 RepID=UPI00036112FB|nr:helix-turn-helix transcriptional regulator [Paenibacillus daejeonensis]
MEYEQLAGRLRAFRKLKGYTQHELAQRLGISVAVLGSLERGTRVPEIKLLDQIATALEVSYDELIGDTYPAGKQRN